VCVRKWADSWGAGQGALEAAVVEELEDPPEAVGQGEQGLRGYHDARRVAGWVVAVHGVVRAEQREYLAWRRKEERRKEGTHPPLQGTLSVLTLVAVTGSKRIGGGGI